MSKALPDDRALSAMVRDALEAHAIHDVAAIYIFGSAANERLRSDSDIDLAFLAPRPQDPVAVFNAAQALATRLGKDVDLIDLRRASTVLRMQVITTGRRILTLDRVEADTFEMYAFSDYARLQEERAPVLRAFESAHDD